MQISPEPRDGVSCFHLSGGPSLDSDRPAHQMGVQYGDTNVISAADWLEPTGPDNDRTQTLNRGTTDISGQFTVVGAVPGPAGHSATTLASTYEMPAAPCLPSCDSQECLQTLTNVPHGRRGQKQPFSANCCPRYSFEADHHVSSTKGKICVHLSNPGPRCNLRGPNHPTILIPKAPQESVFDPILQIHRSHSG